MITTTTTAASPTPVAPVCPFCRSAVVSTNGKTASDNCYWRCDTCGEIWNPSRLVLRPPPSRLW